MRPRPVDHEYKERLPRSMFSLRLGGGYIGFCELAILLTPRAATILNSTTRKRASNVATCDRS